MSKRRKNKEEPSLITKEITPDSLHSICKANPVLAPYLTSGLGALRNNERKKIKVPSTTLLQCSVNLDDAAKQTYPVANRWDYALEYASETYFIEIHPAQTSEIDCMIKKVEFIKSWLSATAPTILHLPGPGKFYWISSGNTDLRITQNSSQARRLALHKIVPVGHILDIRKISS